MMNTKMILGIVAAASVGAIAAILFSPGKGSDTRRKIMDKTGDWGCSVKDWVSGWVKSGERAASSMKKESSSVPNMNLNTMG